MLKDSFYHITSSDHTDGNFTVAFEFDSDHAIFSGHFPGQPIVPGACMLQIVKEVLAKALGTPVQLKKADNLKFIAPVDPRMAGDTELKISYKNLETGIQVNAQLNVNGVTCFKMQGIFSS
ncbi:3-hydroxyacyl-ACP dehydratase [Mucilaginibacter boryungensis]|uniref:3-hydroxyacyl-ACP dehydratase n=1 Tax=Mucilaginibacter boryungensis TaxID=768480 RepID=A0ABR9XLW3_9SPHI|nr:3-hydroxyacyl-ACP dehydratase [Mucilaginibacter boryungensis]MBE9668044.1 3-hydroxyacyl-ACP dehydratase [Mucilaginibacter boryungensis]